MSISEWRKITLTPSLWSPSIRKGSSCFSLHQIPILFMAVLPIWRCQIIFCSKLEENFIKLSFFSWIGKQLHKAYLSDYVKRGPFIPWAASSQTRALSVWLLHSLRTKSQSKCLQNIFWASKLRLLVWQYMSSSKSHLFTHCTPALNCGRMAWKIICATDYFQMLLIYCGLPENWQDK